MVSTQTQHPTAQGSLPAQNPGWSLPVPFIARLELGEQGRPPPLRLHDRPRRQVGSKIPGMMLVLQQCHVLQEQTQLVSLLATLKQAQNNSKLILVFLL